MPKAQGKDRVCEFCNRIPESGRWLCLESYTVATPELVHNRGNTEISLCWPDCATRWIERDMTPRQQTDPFENRN